MSDGEKRVWEWECVSLSDAVRVMGFPAALRDALEMRWIVTLPEFLASLGELHRMKRPPCAIDDMNAALRSMDESISKARPGSELAKYLDAAGWEKYKTRWMGGEFVEFEGYSDASPRVRDPNAIKDPPTWNIERSFDIKSYFPLHEQGRGSCVAHAIAIFNEVSSGAPFQGGNVETFYERCKELDGANAAEGTKLQAAISLAQRLGIWNQPLRQLNPGLINELKAVIYGVDGRRWSPIVASFKTFSSVCQTRASWLSGKWTLPFDGEDADSSHAITLVGYKDDHDHPVPGGGYFIARNSWGQDYASQSDRPGHTRIPYAYAQLYCEDAYAVMLPAELMEPTEPEETPWAPGDDFERRFTWKLSEDDIERFENKSGRHARTQPLSRGTVVIGRRDDPVHFAEDNPHNRKMFEDSGFGWSKRGRARRFFPKIDESNGIDAALEKETKRCAEARDAFMDGVRVNVERLEVRDSTLSRYLLSRYFRYLLSRYFFCAPKFRVEPVSDDELSKAVRTAIANENGLSELVDLDDVPSEYVPTVKASASVGLWRVDQGKAAVVAAFIEPLAYRAEESPVFVELTESLAKVVVKTVKERLSRADWAPEIICAAFGTTSGASKTFVAAAREEGFAFASGSILREDLSVYGRCWQTESFAPTDGRAEPFRAALRPTTDEELDRIVLNVADSGFQGNVTSPYVLRKLDNVVSKDDVERAFERLVRSGELVRYKTARGEDAVRIPERR